MVKASFALACVLRLMAGLQKADYENSKSNEIGLRLADGVFGFALFRDIPAVQPYGSNTLGF